MVHTAGERAAPAKRVAFWDASAVVAVGYDDPRAAPLEAARALAAGRTVWWGTRVECASAAARLRREGALTEGEIRSGEENMDRLLAKAAEIRPGEAVRTRALKLVRTHVLRAGDALQLAAALEACEGDPVHTLFVCLDERLAGAARREGFRVLPD